MSCSLTLGNAYLLSIFWSGLRELNPQPPPWQGGRLPLTVSPLTINPLPSMQKVKVYTEGTPAFLPSSLTNIVPDALGFSPHPPVSVYGTNFFLRDFDAFLDTLIHTNPRCQVSLCFRDYNRVYYLLRGKQKKYSSFGFA